MVFAQHEVAAGQLIHGQIQLGDLADRFVARGDHHAFGALQRFEPLALGVRREGVGQYVFKVKVFQAVQNARPGAVGIFLDVEDGAKMVFAIRGADDEVPALGTENMFGGWQVVVNRRFEHRHRLVGAVDDVGKKFQHLGKNHAIGGFVHAQAIRRIVVQHGFDVGGQFGDFGNRLVLLGLQLRDVGGFFNKPLPLHHRPIDHGEIQLVLHDFLLGERAVIVIGKLLIECLIKTAGQLKLATAAHIMHPEGDIDVIRCAQGLQQAVEGVVAMLQLPLLATDKGQPVQIPRNKEVTRSRFDHMGRYMARERDKLADTGVRGR